MTRPSGWPTVPSALMVPIASVCRVQDASTCGSRSWTWISQK